MNNSELDRIRVAYLERDAAAPAAGRSPFMNAAYVTYLHQLEWDVLRGLRAAGVTLTGADVLDVGSGSGQLLHRLVEFGAGRGAAVELIEHRVAEARRRYPTLDVRVGDASRLPFEDGGFDIVTQFTCLSSVLEPGMRSAIAAEMWRVVRPGGAVLSYDLRPSPAVIRAAGALMRRRAGAGPWTPVAPLAEGDLRRLFPGEPVFLRSVSLNAALPDALRGQRALALMLSRVPALRSHLLAVVVKPR